MLPFDSAPLVTADQRWMAISRKPVDKLLAAGANTLTLALTANADGSLPDDKDRDTGS